MAVLSRGVITGWLRFVTSCGSSGEVCDWWMPGQPGVHDGPVCSLRGCVVLGGVRARRRGLAGVLRDFDPALGSRGGGGGAAAARTATLARTGAPLWRGVPCF